MNSIRQLEEYFSRKEGNFWLDLYPTTKLLLVACVIVSSFFSPTFLFGYIVLVICSLAAISSSRQKQFWKVMRHVFFLFVFLIIFLRTIFHPEGEILFSLGPVHFRLEGLILSLKMTSIILSISSTLVLFNVTTSSEDLMIALEKAGFSYEISFIFLSTFQMIPELSSRAKAIQDSQKSRGIEVEGNVFVRIRALMPMLGPLILSSIADAEEKSLALESRGFNFPANKTHIKIIYDSNMQAIFRKILVIISIIFCIAGGFIKWNA